MRRVARKVFIGAIAAFSLAYVVFCIRSWSTLLNSRETRHVAVITQRPEIASQRHKTVGTINELDFNPVNITDAPVNQDRKSLGHNLRNRIRILCWIMTNPGNLESKARYVRDTWARRCNKWIFVSSTTNTSFPTHGVDVSEGRQHLAAKSTKAFRYIYENYMDEADWFLRADDDTYVILENLRYFLSNYNSEDPIYFGQHFHTIVRQGYPSGGAGYVISKEAMRRLGPKANDPKVCRQDGSASDAAIGQCLENLGVKIGNSLDSLGRSRFNCFDPITHLTGRYPEWFYTYDPKGSSLKGIDAFSDYVISFHYVKGAKMLELEFFIYHLRPYGGYAID